MSSSPLMALKWTIVMSCVDTSFLHYIDLSSLFPHCINYLEDLYFFTMRRVFALNFIYKVL